MFQVNKSSQKLNQKNKINLPIELKQDIDTDHQRE